MPSPFFPITLLKSAAATPPPPAEAAPKTAAEPPPILDPDLLRLDPNAPAVEKSQQPPKPPEKAQEKPPEKPAEKVPEKAAAKPVKAPDAKAQETRPQEAKPRPPRPDQPKPQQSAKLDLSMPPATMASPSFSGRGGAGLERPAGITRSGENDAFARGVIKALQLTMPQLRDTLGRVTVRIVLNMNGNLVSTQVIRTSNVPGLDQSVVFATKQSSFPFPPRNAVPDDLVFNVTYIYY